MKERRIEMTIEEQAREYYNKQDFSHGAPSFVQTMADFATEAVAEERERIADELEIETAGKCDERVARTIAAFLVRLRNGREG